MISDVKYRNLDLEKQYGGYALCFGLLYHL
jgi:hypothetical protein